MRAEKILKVRPGRVIIGLKENTDKFLFSGVIHFRKQTFQKPLTLGEVARFTVTERADRRQNHTEKLNIVAKSPLSRLVAPAPPEWEPC